MKTIGITGGVGSGKTLVLEYLKEKYDAQIMIADKVAHELEEPGQACYNELVARFGDAILQEDGRIDKAKFAAVLFSGEENRRFVNEVIHPAVKKKVFRSIEEAKQGNRDYFVLEAALLIEDGYLEILDEIWYIHADIDVRSMRLKESRGYSDEKIKGIMASQLQEEEYRKYCHRVITNNGNPSEVKRQIDEILGEDRWVN